ncbi:MAG: hypothetical protein P8R42_01370 [Candidatus Binatia bacterium]|nr:hypothetical protein [Candidatus Binatia bacterium]
MLTREDFRRGFSQLARYGLSFDAWLFHAQIDELTALARQSEETTIVLDHVGGRKNRATRITNSSIVKNPLPATSKNNDLVDDPRPNNVTIQPGSVTNSQGVILSEDPLSVNIGSLDPGEIPILSFDVTIDPSTPHLTNIVNQGTATGTGIPPEPDNNNMDGAVVEALEKGEIPPLPEPAPGMGAWTLLLTALLLMWLGARTDWRRWTPTPN